MRRAWDAPNSPQPRVQIRLAGKDFARSGAILIRLVLQGIAMWLTQKGVNKIGELVAELRKSKLGPRFAAWVEENAAALMRDPRLKPHRGQGSAAKEVVSEAQSPSKLANRPKEEAPPPPPPPPPPKNTFPKTPEEMSKALGVEPKKIGTTPDGTTRVTWEPNANTRIRYESHPEGLQPSEPGFNPRHHGEHYHIEMKPDGISWNQANKQGLITKAKPANYQPGTGTGFLPGEPFPGQ